MIRPQAWCAAMALTLVPVVAGAQTARNPFADLFGRARSEGSGAEVTSVQVRTTAGAQIGQTIRADFDQQDAVPEGIAAGADVSLTARHLTDRVQMTGQGRYSYQEFRREPAFGAPGFDANGRINFKATTRLSLYGGGQFMRSPYFRLMWLAPDMFGPSVATGPGSAILMQSNDTAEGLAGFTAQIGRRTSLDASGFTRRTRFAGAPLADFTSTGGRALLRRNLTRSLAIRAGYVREELRGAPGATDDRYVNEIIDVGVDFARAFSMGRRTSLAFATETSIVRHGGQRDFRLNGFVAFERRFLRTWITQLSARRGTEFIPGFKAPVYTDRGGASLAGYLTKRLLFQAHGEGGRGAVGVAGRVGVPRGDANRFNSYSADASLTLAMTRHFGVFTQYYFYNYQMPPDPLALVTVQHLSRQTVSIGVKTWISIIDKEKVPRDPR
jgi:hypothetical protein